MRENAKTFDNVASRSRLTKARDESLRIQRRVARLDAALLQELGTRIRDADAALLHLQEVVSLLRIPAHRERSFRSNVNTHSDRW